MSNAFLVSIMSLLKFEEGNFLQRCPRVTHCCLSLLLSVLSYANRKFTAVTHGIVSFNQSHAAYGLRIYTVIVIKGGATVLKVGGQFCERSE